jgi:carboxymethylenebutenolidase
MPRESVEVRMPDGTCSVTLHLPASDRPRPGVLMIPDAGGSRETMQEMADQLAGLGYVVLLPDIYYRAGTWAPFDVATLFTDEAERARMGSYSRELTNDRIVADARTWADVLLSRPETTGTAIGTTGYCLGGRMSLIVATGLGERVAATASFHGGRLAVPDDPTSPHLAVNRITARIYVAGAEDDPSFTPEQAALLQASLTGAGVDHSIEIYPARHGFAVPDNPTYNADAAARHWSAVNDLYAATLPH